ncbi:tryptophan-rich sensory protein [Pedobacter psychrophilus]|nr:tryptophan-rich sensory protein [Pedobacter psychrophilus]
MNNFNRKGLIINLSIFLILVLIINGLLFGFGWDTNPDAARLKEPYIDPSGTLIGSVWVVLTLILSLARWLTLEKLTIKQLELRRKITLLLILCISYPLYTLAISGLVGIYAGLLVNIIILSVIIYILIVNKSLVNRFGLLVLPVFFWVIFATTVILSELDIIF